MVSAGGVRTTGGAGTVVVTTGGVTVTVGAGEGVPVTVVVGVGPGSGLVAAKPAVQPTSAARSPTTTVARMNVARRGREDGAGWDMLLHCLSAAGGDAES